MKDMMYDKAIYEQYFHIEFKKCFKSFLSLPFTLIVLFGGFAFYKISELLGILIYISCWLIIFYLIAHSNAKIDTDLHLRVLMERKKTDAGT